MCVTRHCLHRWSASKAARLAYTQKLQCDAKRGPSVPAMQDFCRVLSELHDKAPVHAWEASKAAIETAFGQPVEQLFEWIDHSAIASGSIAQVSPRLPLLL